MLALALAVSMSLAAPDAAPRAAHNAAKHRQSARAPKPFRGWRRFGRWMLYVSGDPFADETTCAVTASGMRYDRGVLTLTFGAHTDVLDAVYRVDGGPPIKANSNDAALSHRGVYLYLDDILNPGAVRVPGEQVRGARVLRVELKRSGHVVTRQLTGLDAALAAARQYRCTGFAPGGPASG